MLAFSAVVFKYLVELRIWMATLAAGLGVLLLTGYSSIILGRSYAIGFLVTMAGALFFRRRFSPSLLVLGAVLVVVLVVGVQGMRRAYQQQGYVVDTVGLAAEDSVGILSDSFSVIDGIAFARMYVDESGYRGGAALLSAAVTFIPRDLWPEKPVTVPLEMQLFLSGADLSGIPIGIFGELYMDFGLVGLALGSPLLGLLVGFVFNLMVGSARLQQAELMPSAVFLFVTFAIALLRSGSQSALIVLGIAGAFWGVFRVSTRLLRSGLVRA
jgi:oligosaccharide repeat unit polymerase